MLTNNEPRNYFIIHANVDQGQNMANVDIVPEALNLLTVPNAVIGSIIKIGFSRDPDGMQEHFMNNYYQCREQQS